MSIPRLKTSRFVILSTTLLILFVVLTSIESAFLLREREVDAWKRQLSNLTLTLADQTAQSLSSAEIALDSIVDRVNSMDIRDKTEFFSKVHTEAFNQVLRDKITGLPQVDVASIVSAQGDVINFTRSFPVPNINLSDRDYFQAHLNDPKLGVFFSAPVKNKGNGKWVFYISRRLSDQSGRFVGLALVGISIDYLTEFYEHLCNNIGEGASITLFRSDFTYMMRWPKNDGLLGTKNVVGTSRLVVEEMKKTNDVIYNDGPRQSNSNKPTARLGAVRVFERLPFIVNLNVNEETFLEQWHHSVNSILAVSVGSIIALLIGSGFLLRVTRQKEKYIAEYESELIRVAHFDALTSLPNRILLEDRMKQAIFQAARNQNQLHVCYLDLDGFKLINDAMGHHAGDEVLIEIAKRIKNTVRGGDTVARLGGDEFVILLQGLNNSEESVTTLERILTAVAEPIVIKNNEVSVSASIGVSLFPLDEDSDTLLRHADQAMYIAKQSGKNRYKIYDVNLR
jgi:diguanylate cyclase (GGDEF)-like protein